MLFLIFGPYVIFSYSILKASKNAETAQNKQTFCSNFLLEFFNEIHEKS